MIKNTKTQFHYYYNVLASAFTCLYGKNYVNLHDYTFSR
ncbi:hypothetical protein SAMN05444364_1067 [Prevotella scopos JCM 17725]|uniref:Uncharacterized protein n=1 Tax=Prevotella scopos JCM 17725 TaxID=1236518 RepID=A0AAX2F2G8_9BACT|nr:hypothetical protein SAMN05444364_1067 [Prevotella scopos JCM 17725]